jgi:hypothetical protein
MKALTRVAATAAAGRVRNGLWLLSIEDRLSFSLAKGVFSGLRIGVRAGKPELRILPGVFASLASIGAGMCEPRDPLSPRRDACTFRADRVKRSCFSYILSPFATTLQSGSGQQFQEIRFRLFMFCAKNLYVN